MNERAQFDEGGPLEVASVAALSIIMLLAVEWAKTVTILTLYESAAVVVITVASAIVVRVLQYINRGDADT